MSNGCICWVIALASEAKTLIEELKMFPLQGDTLFPVYKNKSEDEWLVITGVGQLNAASGVSYLYSLCPYARTSFWINFGIAGAGKNAGNIGEIFIVNELRNDSHGKVYYPFILPNLRIKSVMLKTYNKPQNNYQNSFLFDMEGWIFYNIVQRKITRELITVIKIISDNTTETTSSINKEIVKKLVKEKIQYLMSLRDICYDLSRLETERKKDHYLFDDITQNVHFTFTESQQLKNFLMRWDVFFPKRSLSSEIKDLNDSKSILDYLESNLNNHELKWE
ncbi:MAG: hypothetical protein ACJ0DD_08405 [Paracoccaceae bacterium]